MAGKIYRRKKSSEFVTLDTHCLKNKNLKWDAKGLHSYLVQLPEDWQINMADLVNRSKDGRDATTSPMKALINAGYVVREMGFDEKGKFDGYDYFVFERPEHADEWKTVNGKTVNGKTVNGKTVTSKNEDSLTENQSKNGGRENTPALAPIFDNLKAEEIKRGLVAPPPPAEAAAPTHMVTEVRPESPGTRVVSPFVMPTRVDTVDEAEEIIMAWATTDGRESVRKWYNDAARNCTENDVKEMVGKFAGVYLTISDEGKRQRMAQDPLQFFKYTFKLFLKNEKAYGARVMPGPAQSPNQPAQKSALPLALQNKIGR